MICDEVKKLLGLHPYDEPSNFVKGDSLFRLSLDRKYGEEKVDKVIDELKGQ